MQTLIEIIAGDLKEKLDKDLVGSFISLLDFATEYACFANPQKETILLGSRLFDLIEETDGLKLSEETKKELVSKAFQIIDKITEESYTDDQHRKKSTLHEFRKYFIDRFTKESIAFQADDISKTFSTGFSLKNISLKLRLGEITGIVGENGNGKTTLLKIIAGILKPTSGQTSYPFLSQDHNDWEKIKSAIAYVPQTIKPFRNIDCVKEQLHFTAAIKGITGQENKNEVDYIITRLGLKQYENSLWNDLSGGFRLRFELARQLIWKPKLLILDEPLANLDIKAQNLLLNDLRNLVNSFKNPLSVIISSQNLYDIEKVADKLLFIKSGNCIFQGTTDDISKSTGTNCYLIDTDCNLLKLHAALQDFSGSIKDIKNEDQYIMITTSKDITSSNLLKKLMAKHITVNYFRDISNSTRLLFDK